MSKFTLSLISIYRTGIPELYSDLVLKEEDLEKLSITTYNETMTTPRYSFSFYSLLVFEVVFVTIFTPSPFLL